MARENVGLGFIFGAVTKGMAAPIKIVASGISAVGDGLKRLGDLASKNPLGTMLDALNLGVLTDIRDQVGQLAGMNTDTQRLTSTFEQFGVQVDEAFSSVAAGLNLSAKDARKWEGIVSSAAMGTNTSIDTAVGAFKALQQQHIDLKAIGIPTFAEYLKLMKVAGLDSGKFTTTLGQLKSEFGLSDDQLKGLLDDFASISKTGNLGADAIGAMSDQVDTLRPILLATLKQKGPAAVATMLKSTQALAAVMQATYGGDPQANLTASLALTEKLANSQLDMSKAFVGLGEYPEMYAMLATNVGSVAEAERLAKSDAVGFVMQLRKVNQQMASKDPQKAAVFMERMAIQLAETSPALADVFKGGKKVDEAFAQIASASGPAAVGALNAVTKAGFRTGRTLSEDVQLALDGFTQKIRNIEGKKMAKLFRDDVIPAISDFGDELGVLAKDDGALGLAIRKLSQFQMVGAAAFLPLDTDWGKKVLIFGKMLAPLNDMIAPFLMTMMQLVVIGPALIGVFSTLYGTVLTMVGAVLNFMVSPLGIVTAGLLALAGVLLLGTERGGQFTDWLVGWLVKGVDLAAKGIDKLAGWIDVFADQLASEESAQTFGEKMADLFTKGVERMVRIIGTMKGLGPALTKLGGALGKLMGVVFQKAKTAIEEQLASVKDIDWTGVAAKLRVAAGEFFAKVFSWENIQKQIDIRENAIGVIDSMIAWVDSIDMDGVVVQLGQKMDAFIDELFDSGRSTNAIGDAFKAIDWGHVWELVKKGFELNFKIMEFLGKLMWEGLKAAFLLLGVGTEGLVRFGGRLVWGLIQGAFAIKAQLDEYLAAQLVAAFAHARDVVVGWKDEVVGVFQGLWDFLVGMFGHSVNTLIGDDFKKIPGVVQPVLDWLYGAFENVFGWVKSLAETASSVLTSMVSAVVSVGRTVLDGVVGGITAAVSKLKDGLGFMKEIVSSIGMKLGVKIDTADATADAAKTAGRQEVLAQSGKDMMEVLIGVVKIGFDTLHGDLLVLQRQGVATAPPARPGAKGGPDTRTLTVGIGGAP